MRFVLLLVAAVVAVVAGVVALQWSGRNATPQPVVVQKAEAPTVDTVDVLVAKNPIPMGTIIVESMVEKQPWPQHLVLDGFVVSGSKDANVVGRVARSNFQAREPFIMSKLGNPNDPSFLAASLPQGMRAVTLSTDAVTGVAGYVFPGDRVDVLLTHNVPGIIETRDSPAILRPGIDKPAYAEALVTNSRVLAVNVRTPPNKDPATEPTTPSTITIEVSPEDAQKIRLSEKIGTLSVALRSMRDKDNKQIADPTAIDNLTLVKVAEVGATPAGVRIIRGAGATGDSAVVNGSGVGGVAPVNIITSQPTMARTGR